MNIYGDMIFLFVTMPTPDLLVHSHTVTEGNHERVCD